jgi:hypothetical protein
MKTILLSTCFCIISLAAYNQEIIKKSHKISAKLYFDKSGNTGISQFSANAVNYGIDYQYIGIIKHINLQLGIYKITKATVFDLPPNYFHTITIPVGIVYENKYFYMMSGSYYEKTYKYSPEEYPMYYTTEIKDFNLGFYLGIGFEKSINDVFSLTADLRKLWNFNNYDTSTRVGANETIGCGFGVCYKL